ncbi:hypothetical protein BV20DRAFT_201146 [Pilatotrama ljubarskyi]|nr:hypothetical protein BV20DRAFT_201146 [Pilatotrama ljubarskyi]
MEASAGVPGHGRQARLNLDEVQPAGRDDADVTTVALWHLDLMEERAGRFGVRGEWRAGGQDAASVGSRRGRGRRRRKGGQCGAADGRESRRDGLYHQ